jgi:hypothetical protein
MIWGKGIEEWRVGGGVEWSWGSLLRLYHGLPPHTHPPVSFPDPPAHPSPPLHRRLRATVLLRAQNLYSTRGFALLRCRRTAWGPTGRGAGTTRRTRRTTSSGRSAGSRGQRRRRRSWSTRRRSLWSSRTRAGVSCGRRASRTTSSTSAPSSTTSTTLWVVSNSPRSVRGVVGGRGGCCGVVWCGVVWGGVVARGRCRVFVRCVVVYPRRSEVVPIRTPSPPEDRVPPASVHLRH